MHTRRLFLLVCLLSFVSPLRAQSEKPADMVLTGGRIYTVNAAQPWAEAIAIRDGKILAVGTNAKTSALAGPKTKKVDLGGRLVLPGLIDSHSHFLGGSLALDQVRLDGAATLGEIQKRIRDYARRHPHGWILGRGWVYSTFKPSGLPGKRMLDEIVPDRPVLLDAYDGHTAWANSKALAAAGITRDTPDPANGMIVRDAAGEATGVLKESASRLVEKIVPEPTRAEKLAALRKGMAEAAQFGLTGIINAGGSLEDLSLYAELEKRGELTLRSQVALMMRPGASEKEYADYEKAGEMYHSDGVRGGLVKGYMDGVIESHTAAMLAPYTDDPSQSGKLNYDVADLKRMVTEIDRRGLQITIHAIGDRGVRTALDAFEAAMAANHTSGRRFRVEHIETISAEDIPRFAKLGVVAGYQPFHANPDDNLLNVWARNAGPERSRRGFAWRQVADAGAHMAFGSDWPVVTQNPYVGMQCALTRKTPDGTPAGGWMTHQTIKLEEVIAGYTIGAAYAQFEEKSRGSLEAGKLADLVVLTADLFKTPVEKMHNTRAWMTMVGGKIVWSTSKIGEAGR